MAIRNTVKMSLRVDKDLKKEADKLFKELGLNTNDALNIFLAQSVKEQNLPFVPTYDDCPLCKIYNKPHRKLKKALKEADDIISGKVESKGYHNVDEMINYILNEK